MKADMNPPDEHPEHDADAKVPEKFVQALRQADNQRVFVPKHVDDAILGEARKHLRAISKPAHDWRPVAWWGAMAASLALVAGWWFKGNQTDQELASADLRHPGDFNGDQQVDVLDALILAQHEQQGVTGGLRDVNGDGVIDEKDAEWIVRQSVRLEKGGRS